MEMEKKTENKTAESKWGVGEARNGANSDLTSGVNNRAKEIERMKNGDGR